MSPDANATNKEISTLNQVAELLVASADMAAAVPEVLELLGATLGMRYATLSLLDSDAGEISIDVASDLTAEQVNRGHYNLGEGVIGKVAETGRAAVIPLISECPDFLNRTGIRKNGDASFICVPVLLGEEVLGTISVDGDPKPEPDLGEDARILSAAAAMLAQGIKTRKMMRESQASLLDENQRLRDQLKTKNVTSRLVGKSREMQIVLDQIAQVADSPSTVLINGETGTGKELVAQALHYSGSRADKPFVRVNCAALPETLIESELFGHEKGAFTGAVASRKGRFEQADGGTIFLDEIGDISPLMQVKLLRVLQEREFERVGGNRTIKVDVRVVTATHRDLMALVKQGRFRGDLYYRINVFPIYLVPLRRRQLDMPLLAGHFLRKYSAVAGKDISTISPEVLDIFSRYAWPGNVRELENTIEHAVILANGPIIRPEHLPAPLRTESALPFNTAHQDYKTMVENFERSILMEALTATQGNINQAAQQLGTTPRIISYRVRQLGIDPHGIG